jgi:hypothetical protein
LKCAANDVLWMAKHTNAPEPMTCSTVIFFLRYLIDSKWFKSFKRYIGMDDEWEPLGGMDDHPGPIDNGSLFTGVYFQLYSPIFAC